MEVLHLHPQMAHGPLKARALQFLVERCSRGSQRPVIQERKHPNDLLLRRPHREAAGLSTPRLRVFPVHQAKHGATGAQFHLGQCTCPARLAGGAAPSARRAREHRREEGLVAEHAACHPRTHVRAPGHGRQSHE